MRRAESNIYYLVALATFYLLVLLAILGRAIVERVQQCIL